MNSKSTLLDFCDDELLRAPLTFDLAVDAVIDRWRNTTSALRRLEFEAVRVVQRHRTELVGNAVRDLRSTVAAEVAGRQMTADPGQPAPRRLELSLIEDDEVSADIEISRSVELIKSEAEAELRHLLTLTSALVNDLNVSRDTNPFRPDSFVRSLWQGVSGMPLSRALQAAFMRDSAAPLAGILRQGYASAAARLEERGITPAKYRTIVPTSSTRFHLDWQSHGSRNLTALRDSMPMPLDELIPIPGTEPLPAPMAPAARAAPPVPNDPQLIELVRRLFVEIRQDPKLPKPATALMMQLQASALRIARLDPQMLEAYEHPVWRFIDALAFALEVAPAAEAERWLTHCRQLVDHLVHDSDADAARFDWASSRLLAFDRHLLEQAVVASQPDIARLQSAIDSASMPIDVGTLDTIPAELMPTDSDPASTAAHALQLQPGTRLRAHLKGQWRMLQVLWCDPIDDHWLLRDTRTDEALALRRRALDRLAAENLAQLLRPRSLVRAAASQVLQGIAAPAAAPR